VAPEPIAQQWLAVDPSDTSKDELRQVAESAHLVERTIGVVSATDG
jgi:hypothetical protein